MAPQNNYSVNYSLQTWLTSTEARPAKENLVRAHSDALAYLRGSGESVTLNCG
jgi:hypothetical protein